MTQSELIKLAEVHAICRSVLRVRESEMPPPEPGTSWPQSVAIWTPSGRARIVVFRARLPR